MATITYSTRKEMMEANGWTEVATGVYSANNNTSSVQSSEAQANIDRVRSRLKRELDEFKAAKSAQRAASSGQR